MHRSKEETRRGGGRAYIGGAGGELGVEEQALEGVRRAGGVCERAGAGRSEGGQRGWVKARTGGTCLTERHDMRGSRRGCSW